MDELGKLSDINSVGDLLDFKLSLKTIAIIAFLWCAACALIIVIMLGGVSNTMDYVTNLLDTAKKTIITQKGKTSKNTDIANNTNNTNNDKIKNNNEDD